MRSVETPVRVVIDTNVLISAMVSQRAAPWQVMLLLTASKLVAYATPQMLHEYERVLRRFDTSVTTVFLQTYRKHLVLLPDSVSPLHSRDPDDDKFLACARACDAHYLITGDQDLHTLTRIASTRIVTPREFLHDISTRGWKHI